MLSLNNVTPEMGEDYYMQEDYYAKEDGPAQACFFGKGCDLLGIKKTFNTKTYLDLINAKSPDGNRLRMIRPKKFDDAGKDSYEFMVSKFLKKLEKEGVKLERADFDNCIKSVIHLNDISVKYKDNQNKILRAISTHPLTKDYDFKTKKKMMSSLMREVCELGALNGSEIKTMPEFYVAFNHETYGPIAHKLIERHFYLKERKKASVKSCEIYYKAFSKYFPEEIKGLHDYRKNEESLKKLQELIQKSPVIGLFNDENIYFETSTTHTQKDEYITQELNKLKITGEFNLESMDKVLSRAEIFYPTKEVGTIKGKLNFNEFCEKYSPKCEQINDELNENIEVDTKLKYHLNIIQSHMLLRHLGEKIDLNDAKIKNLAEDLCVSISQLASRAALDFTFSAPKSLSLRVLINEEKNLLSAHQEAVDFTLKYIEDNYIGTRSGSKEARKFEKTGNMIGCQFHHGASREQDPQIHTHCLVMNTTMDSDGKWKAIHNDGIFNDKMLIGLIYMKKLADLVINQGYEIEPRGDGTFEITGQTKEQIEAFSKRSKQIKDVVELEGLSQDGHGRAKAACIQKKKKEEISREELFKKWVKEKDEHGISFPPANVIKPAIKKIKWKIVIDHLAENDSHWTTKDLFKHSIIHNMDRGSIEDIIKYHEYKSEIAAKNEQGEILFQTNKKTIKMEEDIVNSLKEGKQSSSPIGDPKELLGTISLPKYINKEQLDALKMSLTNKDKYFSWHGVAGSGKSTSLVPLNEFCKKQGIEVTVLATEHNTVNALSEKLKSPGRTLQSFINNPRLNPRKNNLIIIDEAGRISTEMMHKLLSITDKNPNTRILFCGDTRQTGAIKAGNPYKLLLNNYMMNSELTEHLRQKGSILNQDAAELASHTENEEDIQKSVDVLSDFTVSRKTRKSRINQVIKKYLDLSKEDQKETIIITDKNVDRLDITRKLREKKGLHHKETKITTLRQIQISDAQKKLSRSFDLGMIVKFHENDKDMRIGFGDEYEVIKVNRKEGKLTLFNGKREIEIYPKRHENLGLYLKENINIAVGDKLQHTTTTKDLNNRKILTVKYIKNEKIHFNETSKVMNLHQNLHLDYAHVQTTYGVQGDTKKNVIILADSSISKQSWYVAITRCMQNVWVITDSTEKLKKRILRDHSKENVTEKIKETKAKIIQNQEINYERELSR